MTAYVGTDVTLTCLVSGIPRPSVTWIKNGLPWKGEGSTNAVLQAHGNEHTIHFQNVTQKEAGLYECHAENTLGKATSSIVYVKVLGKSDYEFIIKLEQLL